MLFSGDALRLCKCCGVPQMYLCNRLKCYLSGDVLHGSGSRINPIKCRRCVIHYFPDPLVCYTCNRMSSIQCSMFYKAIQTRDLVLMNPLKDPKQFVIVIDIDLYEHLYYKSTFIWQNRGSLLEVNTELVSLFASICIKS